MLIYLVCALGSQKVQGISSDLNFTYPYKVSLSSHEWEWCESSLGENYPHLKIRKIRVPVTALLQLRDAASLASNTFSGAFN